LLRRTIRPEFLNRIDEIVLFKPLTKNEIRKIVDIQLERVQKQLSEKEITLVVSEEAKDWLAQTGYDVTYGARPLKRVIQKYLVNPLAQELLAGNFSNGDTVRVNISPRVGLVFSK
jgi:ATP-dependent Clp protease ATP-binding subunit ClpB